MLVVVAERRALGHLEASRYVPKRPPVDHRLVDGLALGVPADGAGARHRSGRPAPADAVVMLDRTAPGIGLREHGADVILERAHRLDGVERRYVPAVHP